MYLHEYLNSDSSESTDGACACVNGEEEDFDWSIEQKLPEDQAGDKLSLNNTVHYGFANLYCGVLSKLQVIFYDLSYMYCVVYTLRKKCPVF